MGKNLLVVGLIWSALSLAGCIVISETETYPDEPDLGGAPPGPTIEQIDAVSKLAFDSSRAQGYKDIAGRNDLAELEQVYLVKAAFKHLAFESARLDVILTLIENPGFGGAAETVILRSLEKLAFESSKQQILNAINQRKG